MPFHLQMPRRLYEEMVAQARAELPNECCGLLAGHLVDERPEGKRVGRVVRCYPLINDAASPKEYYAVPSAAFRDIRETGLELLAIYHSHPTSDPVPSRTDLERNYYGPEVVNFIISLKEAEPRVRGWWLGEKDYREAEWEWVEERPAPTG
jgi:proteasome lid subunit RPN8/RPN11